MLQTPAPLLRGGFRGHPATRLQTRVDSAFFDGRNPLSDTTDVTSDVSDVADDAGTATATKRRRGGTGLSAMLLPELQSLAASLGISGTARMRKGELITAISERQGGGAAEAAEGTARAPRTRSNAAETRAAGARGRAAGGRRRRRRRPSADQAPTTQAARAAGCRSRRLRPFRPRQPRRSSPRRATTQPSGER